jgi:hypothetical protein
VLVGMRDLGTGCIRPDISLCRESRTHAKGSPWIGTRPNTGGQHPRNSPHDRHGDSSRIAAFHTARIPARE